MQAECEFQSSLNREVCVEEVFIILVACYKLLRLESLDHLYLWALARPWTSLVFYFDSAYLLFQVESRQLFWSWVVEDYQVHFVYCISKYCKGFWFREVFKTYSPSPQDELDVLPMFRLHGVRCGLYEGPGGVAVVVPILAQG